MRELRLLQSSSEEESVSILNCGQWPGHRSSSFHMGIPGKEGPAVLRHLFHSIKNSELVGKLKEGDTDVCFCKPEHALRLQLSDVTSLFWRLFLTGWAEATKTVSGALWAAGPPSFTAHLHWHRDQPQMWDFCGFPASQSFCLQGWAACAMPASFTFSCSHLFLLLPFDLDLHFAFN